MEFDYDALGEDSAQVERDRRRSWWLRRPSRRMTAAVVLLALVVAGGSFWKQPFYAISPGSVRDTASRIDVVDSPVFAPEGEIGFVTVRLTERVNAFEYVRAKFDGTIDLVDEDIINGDGTADEKREEDRRRMQESKDTATLVALAHLGYPIEPIGLGVEVVDLTPCLPAEDVLKIGDLIIGINGGPVEFSDDLTEPLDALDVGDSITLEVDRFDTGDVERVDLTLGSSAAACLSEEFRTSDEDERAMIGIRLSQMLDYELPVDVQIDTDRVGGPSAGLAFSLSVIDVLTEGELTGGADVATTGTIDLQGNVGRVGGVKQKTVAARDSGASLFLVPPGEGEEAEGYAGDMEVREVATLTEALAALDSLGGNSLNLPEVAAGS